MNKLYEEDSVKAIANAIRAKNGSTTTYYKIAEMAAAVSAIETGAEPLSIEWHQCPELVRSFIANVTYDPDDYSTSQIENYAPETAVAPNYKPIGYTVDDETFYNQVPNAETDFRTNKNYGTLKPLDKVRYINTPSAPNVRDLGGWACDGGTVKYGLLFRGGYLNATDRDVCVGELGIRHDLDLRGTAEAGITASPLGGDVHYTCATNYNWYSLTNSNDWTTNLRCVFDAVTHNEPVYFHCTAGADRTGTLACVLEGLLGMSQSDIDKDYELTCFYSGVGNDVQARRRNEAEWTGLIKAINEKTGDTFMDKCVTFVAELGFTADEINAYRTAMIDGTPSTVTPSISTFTVINSLTNAVNDNLVETATQYQPYEANISPSSEHIITEIVITMGGKNVTSQVWKATEAVLRRKVTLTVENATTSNKAVSVTDGESYVSQITAIDGYTLEGAETTITMGGADMSTYYSNGTIAIPRVTGDIVITVKAVESAPQYDNLIRSSLIPGTTDIYGTNGYVNGTRYNSSGTVVATECTGSDGVQNFTTGVIQHNGVGTKLRFVNCWITTDATYGLNAGSNNTWIFNDATPSKLIFSGGSLKSGTWEQNNLFSDVIYADDGQVVGFTIGSSSQWVYSNVAFTLTARDASKAIVYIED